MNVAELKKILKSKKKAELEELVLTLYRHIPMKKIEIEGIDKIFSIEPANINNNIHDNLLNEKALLKEINTFNSNFLAGNYGLPNRIISKDKRSKWRFEVIRFYKEVVKIFPNATMKLELAESFGQLYDAMVEGCSRYLCSSEDCFASVQKSQTVFFIQVIQFKKEVLSGEALYRQLMEHIMVDGLSYDTLSSELYAAMADSFASPMALEDLAVISKEYCKNTYEKYSQAKIKDKYASSYNVKKLIEGVAIILLKLKENQDAKEIFYQFLNIVKDNNEMYYIMVRTFRNYCYKPNVEILDILNHALAEGINMRSDLTLLHQKLIVNPNLDLSDICL